MDLNAPSLANTDCQSGVNVMDESWLPTVVFLTPAALEKLKKDVKK